MADMSTEFMNNGYWHAAAFAALQKLVTLSDHEHTNDRSPISAHEFAASCRPAPNLALRKHAIFKASFDSADIGQRRSEPNDLRLCRCHRTRKVRIDLAANVEKTENRPPSSTVQAHQTNPSRSEGPTRLIYQLRRVTHQRDKRVD